MGYVCNERSAPGPISDEASDIRQVGKAELEKRESELKERALRNKVVRTRKTSAANGAGPSTSAGN